MPGYLDLAREALGAVPPEPPRAAYEENEINEQIAPCDQAGSNAPAAPCSLTPTDHYEFWGERAAIRQYDGGFPRDRAEALALADLLHQIHLWTKDPGHTCPTNQTWRQR
jgi:hypothetical protein